MTDRDYELVSPVEPGDWRAYHEIRRTVLWESRGAFGVYDENHPDERADGHHPKLLRHRGEPVGVVRIDVAGSDAIFRRVAIRSAAQRRGHGRVLLARAEQVARSLGCTRLMSNVAPDAVGFYRACGFAVEREGVVGPSGHTAVLMTKAIAPG